jgi:hypothetical protein
MISKAKLLEYCEKHEIAVPKNATREVLHAAIVRALFHKSKPPNVKTCFGFWENEDSNCFTCQFEEACFITSLGMSKKAYLKAIENSPIRVARKKLRK